MAKIQIIDVPPAPKGDATYLGEARGGEITPTRQRYQEATNFERHIPGLMQPELSQAPYDALADAQAGIGGEIAQAGQQMAALGRAMQESKDAADVSRAHLQMNTVQAAYEQRVVERKVPASARLELWDAEFAPMIQQGLESMKMSPSVFNRVMPEAVLFNRKARTGILHDANKEQIELDRQAIQQDFEAAIEAGDWEGPLDANGRLQEGRHQSPAQAQARVMDIKRAKQEWDIREDMGNHPRMVLEEMQEIQRTGKSDIYPEVKNPTIVNKYADMARQEINQREVDTLHEIQDAKDAGKLTRPEDVDRMSKGNLTADKVAAVKNELLHDPQYDKEAVVTMRTKVQAYNPEDDDEYLTKFHTLYEEIGTSVPKDIQGALRSDLYQEYQRKRDGKPKDNNKSIDAAIDAEILNFAKAGMFDPEGYSSVEAAKDPTYLLRNRDKHLEVWSKVESYQRQIKEWRAAHPDASPEQIAKQIDQTIGPELRRSAKQQMDWRKLIEKETSILPPGARDKLRQPPSPAEIRDKLTPRYEFGKGMADIKSEDAHVVGKVTGYRPGGNASMGLSAKMEGGIYDAHGNIILGRTTMEDYLAGRGPYVTVAMDKSSDWQGKFLRSPQYPGVVFKVMDNGGYGNNKTGRNWIDIAWANPQRAKDFVKRNVQFEVVDSKAAAQIRSQRAS